MILLVLLLIYLLFEDLNNARIRSAVWKLLESSVENINNHERLIYNISIF